MKAQKSQILIDAENAAKSISAQNRRSYELAQAKKKKVQEMDVPSMKSQFDQMIASRPNPYEKTVAEQIAFEKEMKAGQQRERERILREHAQKEAETIEKHKREKEMKKAYGGRTGSKH